MVSPLFCWVDAFKLGGCCIFLWMLRMYEEKRSRYRVSFLCTSQCRLRRHRSMKSCAGTKEKQKLYRKQKAAGLRPCFLMLYTTWAATGYAIAPMHAKLCRNKNRKKQQQHCAGFRICAHDLIWCHIVCRCSPKKRMRPEIVPKIKPKPPQNL